MWSFSLASRRSGTSGVRAFCGSRASAGSSSCFRASACRWGINRSGGELSSSGAGALVTAVTLLFLPEDVVWFGVLTLLGSAMLLTAVLDGLLRRIPPAAGVVVSAALFWVTYPTMRGFWNLPGGRLALPQALYANGLTAYLGFMPKDFFSTDYFPLLPWLFLFWVGYFLYQLAGRAGMEPLRRSVCPPLGWMGRHSLVLYLLHQPVILGVLTVAFRLMRAA